MFLNVCVYCKYCVPEDVTFLIISILSWFFTKEHFYTHLVRFTSFMEQHTSQDLVKTDTLSDENLKMAGIGRNM